MLALIVPSDVAAHLASHNSPIRSLRPVKDILGRDVLNADLLTDLVTWADYADILTILPIEDVELPIYTGAH